jgi:hypothetical protein
MKTKVHIPTMEYGFIEIENDVNNEEAAIELHDKVVGLVQATGLNQKDWKKTRDTMLKTGEFDPNISDQLSRAQRWFINELKLAIRAIKNEQ